MCKAVWKVQYAYCGFLHKDFEGIESHCALALNFCYKVGEEEKKGIVKEDHDGTCNDSAHGELCIGKKKYEIRERKIKDYMDCNEVDGEERNCSKCRRLTKKKAVFGKSWYSKRS